MFSLMKERTSRSAIAAAALRALGIGVEMVQTLAYAPLAGYR